jgi:acetyl-CoA decarbonylase/synthase complex subunit gamma
VRADRVGALKARLGINRMHYTVPPGLYAVGNPDPDSVVLVSANYKLSFDALRKSIAGIDAWIMVLDTKGINVWCSAGKGTFGTEEVVNRIKVTALAKIANGRKLILPQLAAVGVSAHEVRKLSGFSVVYGPVRARDIKAFLDARMRAAPEMRRVRFSFRDRLVLAPMEVVGWAKYFAIGAGVFFLLAGLSRDGYSGRVALAGGMSAVAYIVLAYLAGTLFVPALLPWLPGRSFSFKGFSLGVVFFAGSVFLLGSGESRIEILGWMFLMPAIASFLAMNFTGASTYTSLSGVIKEMRVAVPLQIGGAAIGVSLWLAARFI